MTEVASTGAAGSAGATTMAPAPEAGGATPKQGETVAQAEARRLKLRIGGQEQEFDESEVATNFEKGRNASKLLSKVEQRRQEALRAKAEADGILGRLKDKGNLVSVLSDLGYTKEDLRKMSEAQILEAIEEEKLTPAERRAKELERERDALLSEKQKQEEERKQAAHAQEVERHKDELANLFVDTMAATGLPKSSGRFVISRMAQLYAQNEEAGLESTPEEMAAHVMSGLQAEHRGVLGGLEGEALMTYLGPEVVKKVLAANLAKVKANRTNGAVVAPAVRQPTAASSAVEVNPRKGRWEVIERDFLK